MDIRPYAKTILGFLTPGAVAIGAAVTDTSDGGSRVTQAEWIAAVVAMIVTGSLVFGVPNKDPHATHQSESVQPPHNEAGESVLYLLVVVVVVVLLVLLLMRLL